MNPPIVIATDFSPAGNSALNYAARLAGRLQCALHVVSVNVTMPPLTAALPEDIIAQMTYVDLLNGQQERSREEIAQARAALLRDFPDLPVEFNILEGGDMGDALLGYADRTKPLLLVLGTHRRDNAGDRWDSSGLGLLRHAAYPLLMVPENYQGSGSSTALLAWDGGAIDTPQRAALIRLQKVLGLQLDAIFVQSEKSMEPDESALAGLPLQLRTVSGTNVTDTLNDFLARDAHDLLIVLPHHHNLWERLFFKLHTAELVSEITVPVLVIPGPLSPKGGT